MIKESDIKVGNVLKYLGGSILYDDSFTIGKVYNVEEFEDGSLDIRDNDEDSRHWTIFKGTRLWNLMVCNEEPSNSSNEIFLPLAKDEAQMLADLIACVGGCPELSRRKFTNSMAEKLKIFNIAYKRPEYADEVDLSGTINCKTIFDPDVEEPIKETIEYNGSTYDKVEFDRMLEKLEKL